MTAAKDSSKLTAVKADSKDSLERLGFESVYQQCCFILESLNCNRHSSGTSCCHGPFEARNCLKEWAYFSKNLTLSGGLCHVNAVSFVAGNRF
jgi:hypothetical protein